MLHHRLHGGAVISGGDPGAGFELVHQLAEDVRTRPLLSVIVYCSAIKGFTHQKHPDRGWVVHWRLV